MVATALGHGFDGAGFHELFEVGQDVPDTASDFSVLGRLAEVTAGLQGFDGPVQKGGGVLLVHEDGAGSLDVLGGVAVGVEGLDGSHDFTPWPDGREKIRRHAKCETPMGNQKKGFV